MRVHGTLELNPDTGNWVFLRIHTEDGVELGRLDFAKMSGRARAWCEQRYLALEHAAHEDGSDDDGGPFGDDPLRSDYWEADRR